MTLIVSEVSEAGIVMTSDSAVSIMNRYDNDSEVYRDATKLVYSASLNVGISCWGHASIDNGRTSIDTWVSRFLRTQEGKSHTLTTLATCFADRLNPLLEKEIPHNGSWEHVRAGFHIAGYKGEYPALYHVHCGHLNMDCHELTLHMDFPEVFLAREQPLSLYVSPDETVDKLEYPYSMNLTRNGETQRHDYGTSCAPSDQGMELKRSGFFQLRNGEIEEFVAIWNDRLENVPHEFQSKGVVIETREIRERLNFYIRQLKEVCNEYYEQYGLKATVQSPVVGYCFNKEGYVCGVPNWFPNMM